MKINGENAELLRSELARANRVGRAGDGRSKDTVDRAGAVSRRDSVRISETGRARTAQLVGPASGGGRAPLTPERVAEIRERLLQGAYDSVEMVGQVAQRLLRSGDLG